jgi:gliding motility-associated lipoprotein GldH
MSKKVTSKIVNSVLVLVVAATLASCGDSPLYTETVAFPDNTWTLENKPQFMVDIPDTSKYYTVDVTVRTTTDYAYNNMWFFLHAKTPNGQTGREPVEVKIGNPDGTWIGEKSGTIVTTSVHFNHRKFPQKGKYYFTLEQGITEKEINEVVDITYTVKEDPTK